MGMVYSVDGFWWSGGMVCSVNWEDGVSGINTGVTMEQWEWGGSADTSLARLV